jgi:hypothetical protein
VGAEETETTDAQAAAAEPSEAGVAGGNRASEEKQ